eukprot:5596728-Alexandrium_andersonii.AAC.2
MATTLFPSRRSCHSRSATTTSALGMNCMAIPPEGEPDRAQGGGGLGATRALDGVLRGGPGFVLQRHGVEPAKAWLASSTSDLDTHPLPHPFEAPLSQLAILAPFSVTEEQSVPRTDVMHAGTGTRLDSLGTAQHRHLLAVRWPLANFKPGHEVLEAEERASAPRLFIHPPALLAIRRGGGLRTLLRGLIFAIFALEADPPGVLAARAFTGAPVTLPRRDPFGHLSCRRLRAPG